jgi:holliday junction DNA helicase RuvA
MIARLRGRPVAWDAEGLVLDVGGVGYRLHATPSAVRKAEGAAEVALETHLHVREDALQLYGFATAGERELFEHLLAVSGVGPKVALAIVSGYSPGELRGAIAREDAALFETIPGIGRKTAQRVVLELKEKIVDPPGSESGPAATTPRDGEHNVARDALVELGYSPAEAERRLTATDPDLPPAERVREALRAA